MEREHSPRGILNSARQVGGTLGIALTGSLLQGRHPEGLLFSFALVLVCLPFIACVTLQAMQECGVNSMPVSYHHHFSRNNRSGGT